MNSVAHGALAHPPSPQAVLELLKPITWFPPMWALGCGVVSSGVAPAERWPLMLLRKPYSAEELIERLNSLVRPQLRATHSTV